MQPKHMHTLITILLISALNYSASSTASGLYTATNTNQLCADEQPQQDDQGEKKKKKKKGQDEEPECD